MAIEEIEALLCSYYVLLTRTLLWSMIPSRLALFDEDCMNILVFLC